MGSFRLLLPASCLISANLALAGSPSQPATPTPTATPNAVFNHSVGRLEADPVRSRAYATLPSENAVLVIDTESLVIIATIPIGSSPQGLGISADGSKLWVANSGSSNAAIGVINLNTLQALPSLPAPRRPFDIEEGLDHRLYVTAADSSYPGGIMQINGETGAYQTSFGGWEVDTGLLEISPDRSTLIYGNTSTSPATLIKYDVATASASQLQLGRSFGAFGEGLCLSHNGQFFVFPTGGGNYGYATYEIPTANMSSVNGTFVVGAYPVAAVFSNDDTLLYHGTASQGLVKVFDTATFNLVRTIPLGNRPGTIYGYDVRDVAIDRSGRWLFVATDDYSMANLLVFDTGRMDPVPAAQVANISTRLRVGRDENVLIGGVIITGTAPKKVIIRGIGPSLAQFVTGALADTTLDLYQGDTLLASNDDWKTNQRAEIEATGIPPANDFESAIVRTLPPGNYTAILRGKGNTTGIGLVETYDLDRTANSKLANISTRGFVDTGDNAMIGGMIVGPANGANGKVVVRAIGPSLSDFGIGGALQDPTLDLVNSHGVILRSNNDWRDTQQAEIEALSLQPGNDRESALVQIVPPGNYTAVVRGSGNSTGVALVEVYHVP